MHFLQMLLRCINAVGCVKKRHAFRCIHKMQGILSYIYIYIYIQLCCSVTQLPQPTLSAYTTQIYSRFKKNMYHRLFILRWCDSNYCSLVFTRIFQIKLCQYLLWSVVLTVNALNVILIIIIIKQCFSGNKSFEIV